MIQEATVNKMNRAFVRAAMFAAILILSACAGQYRNHGYMPPTEQIDALVVGVDTRDGIIEAVGGPTTNGVEVGNTIYFVRSRVHHKGYAKPDEINREVLILSFGKNQVLRNVERFGIEKGRLIALEHRVTESPGGDRSMLQQIMSSIGGFNTGSIMQGE